MSVALYRKYRSRKLQDVVGQDHVTKVLAAALEKGRVSHAYLFTGPRGVGKTSIARILAHEINGLVYDEEATNLDIIEIDAASNNGVEDIRDLRDRVQIAPVSAKKKVYIIDEVHMLSKAAFNALLKTLEEPPEHVVFILATTDIDKVPETIISRTQRYSFKRASVADIITNLQKIAKSENITVTDEALELIAQHSDGSFRDSVSLFDQLSSSAAGELSKLNVQQSLGLHGDDTVHQLLTAVRGDELNDINTLLKQFENSGVPARTTSSQLMQAIRHDLVANQSLIPLLDSLLDVAKSSYPELKLLSVLALFAPSSQIIAPIQTTATKKVDSPTSQQAKKTVATKVSVPKAAKQPEPVLAEEPTEVVAVVKLPEGEPDAFDWAGVLAHVRTHYMALHSFLQKADAQRHGNTVTVFTKSAFYKKKLDETKYRVQLNDSLEQCGHKQIEIVTLPSAAPLKNSQAAKVAAMMGGGEEVSVEDA